MAALNTITREWADELRGGIAWVIIWRTGRSWNAQAVWLNCDDDTFEPEDLELAREILAQDPDAVMLNGYYCGHLGEDMTVAELAAGIRWHYENGYNKLEESVDLPEEVTENPAGLPESSGMTVLHGMLPKDVKGYKVFNPDWTCRDKQYTCPGKIVNTGKGCTGLHNSGEHNSS